MTSELCPCGSGNLAIACCLPYLAGEAVPATPEQLMRSRYTAFCHGAVDYLIDTRHPTQRRPDDQQTLAQTIAETEWLGLRVLATEAKPATPNQGFVEFVAFYRSQGHFGQLHEKSEFRRQDARWYYLQGVILAPIPFKRNDPCWCGSGKKYKQCHGA